MHATSSKSSQPNQAYTAIWSGILVLNGSDIYHVCLCALAVTGLNRTHYPYIVEKVPRKQYEKIEDQDLHMPPLQSLLLIHGP